MRCFGSCRWLRYLRRARAAGPRAKQPLPHVPPVVRAVNRPHLAKSSEGLPHVVAAERPELVLGVGHVPEGLRGLELIRRINPHVRRSSEQTISRGNYDPD